MRKNNIYKSKQWLKLREYVLRRDGYICQESKRYGKVVPANMVHHIYPVEDYPELFYNPDNLISLSNYEHNRMHDRLTDEITEKGLKWQKKVEAKIFGKDNK